MTPRSVRTAEALVLALCGLLAPEHARAEDAPATLLEWRAPDGCPEARAVYDSLSQVLGRAPSEFGAFSRVSGAIEPRGNGWLLTIEMVEHGQHLTRLISAPRCDDLADAAAVAIGLALDQQRREQLDASAARRSLDGASATPPLAEPTADALDARDAASASRAPRFGLGVDAVLDVNTLPSLAPGVSVNGRLLIERTRLALYGALLPPSELSVRDSQAVDFSLLVGGAQACYALLPGRLATSACGGIEVGRFSADGGELRGARRADNLWLAPEAGLELDTGVWRTLEATLRADALLPLVRKQYAVNETELVYRPPAVSLRFYVGLSLATD